MQVRLLGAVELSVHDRPVACGGPRQRGVLAALAVDVGRPVPIDTLIERVWDEEPPAQARRTLYVYVARLRTLLRGAGHEDRALVRTGPGYLLDLDVDRVDLHRFQRRAAEGRAAPDPARRAAVLREALGHWDGTPLAGLTGGWAERMRQTWSARHLDAVIAWAEAELASGGADTVVTALDALVADHPLAEDLVAVLIRAQHATGRRAAALRCYVDLRRRLAHELGCDPGPAVRRAYQEVLRAGARTDADAHGENEGDGDGDRPARPSRPGPDRWVTPAQLPAAVPGFAGRGHELARLDAALLPPDAADSTSSASGRVWVLSGGGGTGKTALAVHWAHRRRPQFTDGQLYLNLRGFDPARRPVPPAEALRELLLSLGLPPGRVPVTPDAQAALLRSLLAARRVLVVLDDVRDAEQVRPLLPGVPGPVTVITSRDRLDGLVALEGARSITVGLLPPQDAGDLLRHRLGAAQVDADPAAAERLMAACARLPLALGIAAARVQQSGFSLADVAAQLDAPRDLTGPSAWAARLDALDTGDPAAGIRAALSCSYSALDPPTARMFRLLGVHPGPDVSVPAAASLTGLDRRACQRHLAVLTRSNLFSEHRPGRYTAHDLVRGYAADLGAAGTGDASGDEGGGDEGGLGGGSAPAGQAWDRLLAHQVHSALAADRLMQPYRDALPHAPTPPGPGVVPERFRDHREVVGWFTAEAPVLLATVRAAVAGGNDVQAWQLAWLLDTYLSWRGDRHTRADLARLALRAAERWGDPAARAHAHRWVARTSSLFGDHDDALDHLRRAARLLTRHADATEQAHAHVQLAGVYQRAGRPGEALSHVAEAVRRYRGSDGIGRARAHNVLSWHHFLLGRHEPALHHGRRAMAVQRRLGDRWGEATTLDSLGTVLHRSGQFTEAAEHHQRALLLFRELGDLANEAETLQRLSDVQLDAGALDAARTSRQRAGELYAALGHPDGQRTLDEASG